MDITPFVSVIIPVFNVELYLRQCLESVIGQTYRNLEILIIDDGSTDGCGKICDEYEKDERVRVFHTENRGLSAARNFGLDNASGEYISFLDSDDWLEEDAIKRTVEVANITGADIVCFRAIREFANKPLINNKPNETQTKTITLTGDDIINEFCKGAIIGTAVWNKIYKAALFFGVRFPEGRNYEDYATVYKPIINATLITCIPDALIHYRERKSSISKCRNLKNINDQWMAVNECYKQMITISQECGLLLLGRCIGVVGRMWRWYSCFTKEEKKDAQPLLSEMQRFAHLHLTEVLGSKNITAYNKALCICAMTKSPIMMTMLHILTMIYRGSHFCGYYYE